MPFTSYKYPISRVISTHVRLPKYVDTSLARHLDVDALVAGQGGGRALGGGDAGIKEAGGAERHVTPALALLGRCLARRGQRCAGGERDAGQHHGDERTDQDPSVEAGPRHGRQLAGNGGYRPAARYRLLPCPPPSLPLDPPVPLLRLLKTVHSGSPLVKGRRCRGDKCSPCRDLSARRFPVHPGHRSGLGNLTVGKRPRDSPDGDPVG